MRSVIALAVLAAVAGAEAQIAFTDQTVETFHAYTAGFRASTMGDVDNDGRVDLFGAQSRTGRLFLGQTSAQGQPTWGRADSDLSGLQDKNSRLGGGAVFGDYDNDGDLDLFVPRGRFALEDRETNLLLRNDRGVFHDVSQ